MMRPTHSTLTGGRFRPSDALDCAPSRVRSSIAGSIMRVVASCWERYGRIEADVLILGIDPLLSLMTAYTYATKGQSVLICFNMSVGVPAHLQEANIARSSMVPGLLSVFLKEKIHGFDAKDDSTESIIKELCRVLMTLRDRDGRPAVRTLKSNSVMLDMSVRVPRTDQAGSKQLFWLTDMDAAPDLPLCTYAMNFLDSISVDAEHDSQIFSIVDSVVYTSPISPTIINSRAGAFIGGGVRPLLPGDVFTWKERFLDMIVALTLSNDTQKNQYISRYKELLNTQLDRNKMTAGEHQ